MINPLTRPVEQPQNLEPFQLPFDQMYQILGERQKQADQLSTAMTGLTASFAGMTARLQPDQDYLNTRNEELKTFVDSLANQDLTKVPQLKQKILNFATDPKLSQIEQNNKVSDDLIKQRAEFAKDYKLSADRWMPVQQSYDEYNSKGEVGQFAPPALMPFYDYNKEKQEALKAMKPFITSEIMTTPDGQYKYVNKLSTISTDEAAARILSSYSRPAMDQLNSELSAGLGRTPTEKEFNDYVVGDALGSVSGITVNGIEYFQREQEISNLTKISTDDTETTTKKTLTDLDMSKADNIFSATTTRAAPLYTVNQWALNPDANIERQLETKLVDLAKEIEGKKKAFKDRFRESYGEGQTIPDYIDIKTEQIATAEANLELTNINAQEDELNYAQSIRNSLKTEAYEEITAWADPSLVKELNNYLTNNKDNSEYLKIYNEEYEKALTSERKRLTTNSSVDDLTSNKKTSSKDIEEKAKQYAENLATKKADEKVANSPLIKKYNDLVEKKLEDKFIYEATFGNAYAFNVADPDYKNLRDTLLTTSLDGWKIYQNSTGKKVENFQTDYMAKEGFDYFNLQGYYYNPVLKKIVAFGQMRDLKPKSEWVPSSDETNYLNWEDKPGNRGNKEDLYNDFFTIEIDTLNNAVMKSMFGEGADATEKMMNYIQTSLQNDASGMTKLPIDVYDDLDSGHYRTDVVIKDLKNGTYTATYYDKNAKKFISEPGSLDQIASGLYNFSKDNYNLINQSLEKRKSTLANMITSSFTDYTPDLQAELLNVIGFETGADPKYKYTHKAINSESGATGFIQFMPDPGKTYKTIGGVQVPMQEIANASPQRQMQFTKIYLDKFKPKIDAWRGRNDNSFGAVYLAVFLPTLLDYNLDKKLKDIPDWETKYKPANPSFASAETIAELLYIVKNNAGSFK